MQLYLVNRYISLLFMFIVYLLVMTGYYFQSRSIMVNALESEIENILITHKAINNYVSKIQKPQIKDLQKKGHLEKDFFSPIFLSSTYTNMTLNSLANLERIKLEKTPLIIKYASNNPTNMDNLATPFEQAILSQFKTSGIKSYQDIVTIDNVEYLYYAQRGKIMEKRCLECHGRPQDAPRMMIEQYGDKNGFGFTIGELSSYLSIKVPLQETLARHQKEFITAAIVVFVLFILLFILSQYVTRYIEKNKNILKRSEKLRKEIKGYAKLVAKSKSDASGIITEVSDAFCDLTGYSRGELIGHSHSILRHPDTTDDFYNELWRIIGRGEIFFSEIKNRKKNGDSFWSKQTIVPIVNSQKVVIAYESVFEDITEKKQFEADSLTDPLTSLYNRRGLESIFEREYQRSRRENYYFAYIMLDIDYFKLYNDEYGHDMGDMVLMKVANEIKNCFRRANDYVFRVGGEEFGVVLTDKDESNIINIANKLRAQIKDLHLEHRKSTISKYVTVSVGVTIVTYSDTLKYIDIYREADNFLYKAKEKGRDRVEYKS